MTTHEKIVKLLREWTDIDYECSCELATEIEAVTSQEVEKYKQLIQVQDELIRMAYDKNYPWNVTLQYELQQNIAQLKNELK